MDKVRYEELRPEEFLERINSCPIGYLPLGTLEWHGYHMPLGADALQSHGVFEILAQRLGGVVMPPLYLGPDISNDKDHYGMDICSFEDGKSQQLHGSCYYVPEDLFGAIMKQTVKNMKRAGFQIVVAHGHGPSMNYVRSHRTDFDLPVYTLFDIACEEGPDGYQADHAASNETSLTMALYPELVDMARIDAYGYPLASWGVDPRTGASAERGNQIIEKNVDKAYESLKAMLETMDRRSELKLDYTNIKDLLS